MTREETAESIMATIDALARGDFDQRVNLKAIHVSPPSGAKIIVVVITEDAWEILQEILAEHGGFPVRAN